MYYTDYTVQVFYFIVSIAKISFYDKMQFKVHRNHLIPSYYCCGGNELVLMNWHSSLDPSPSQFLYRTINKIIIQWSNSEESLTKQSRGGISWQCLLFLPYLPTEGLIHWVHWARFSNTSSNISMFAATTQK